MSVVPELQAFVTAAIQSETNNNYTALPCIVVGVRGDGANQMVDIQPSINQLFKDGTIKERPPVLGVPVSFPVSSKAGFTWPVEVGDTGIAVFAMRNIDAWKSGNGKNATPLNYAKMDKSDAMFIPGIQPQGMAVNNPSKHILPHSTKDTVMFANLGAVEAEFRIKADGSIGVTTSNMPITIEGSDVTVKGLSSIIIDTPDLTVDANSTTWIGNITLQGNLTQTGNYSITGQATFNGIPFSTHKHVGVVAGGATSGGPTA